jgi:hypothetical protein
MISPHALWTVARVEVKTLLRSWFFRILAGLSIGVLFLVNLVLFTDLTGIPWMLRGIAASIPYVNILFLNLIQAAVAVFLASEFLKRDRKMDSTDVVYMRSMSNGDYVIGKTVGILIVFGGLNVAILVMGLVFNAVFSGVPVVLRAYLYYPLLVSVPTLVYILGLSFLLMVLIRNQAVTLIVLLGYVGTALIYLGPRVHSIYDYMAFHFPMLYSGFIGFGNIGRILVHRGMYLSLGLACILFAVLMLRRLPQSRSMVRLAGVLSVVFVAAAVVLGGLYLDGYSDSTELRDGMRALDNRIRSEPRVSMKRCYLDLHHEGATIRCTARMLVENETAEPISRYRFSLNPDLAVTSIRAGGERLEHERDLHVVYVTPPRPLSPGMVDSLELSYRGGINEDICYLDVDEEILRRTARVVLYPVDKRYGFITPSYVLLTPEVLWYPTPCAQFSPDHPTYNDGEFTVFLLDVTTAEGLSAFSQGEMSTRDGGFTFSPETPLPGLTLCIGSYDTHAVTVDSITYRIALQTGYDVFTPYLAAIGDTLPALIRDCKGDFERLLELSYPFSRLTLLEVPVQFYGYRRLWTVREETVQPEMILVPERGVLFPFVDFKQLERPRGRRRRGNEQTTPREQQARVFQTFIRSAIAGTIRREPGFRRSMNAMSPTYSVVSNYFALTNKIRAKRLQVLESALESYIVGRIEQAANPVYMSYVGVTNSEKANLALRDQSLAEILADPERRDLFHDILRSKGYYLFVMLQERVGREEFQRYLADLVDRTRFRVLDEDELIEDMHRLLGFDLEPHIDRWYHDRSMPGYIIGGISSYQVMDVDRTKFQVKFTVSNTEPVDGYLHVTFRGGERRRFSMRDADEADADRIIAVKGNQTKECGILLDFKPRVMRVNTLISRNIPSILHTDFIDFELDERAKPFDGERVLDEQLDVVGPGEIVVDNEDDGFEAGKGASRRFLGLGRRRTAESDEEKYEGIRYWEPPKNRWAPVTLSDFFGRHVRSAVYTRAGKGDMRVSWNASIPVSGTFDVYYYVSMVRRPWVGAGEEELGQYHFVIEHDDGTDDVVLDINGAVPGWNYLGSYYLSAGNAKVELTNESKGILVVADAVKWVKR